MQRHRIILRVAGFTPELMTERRAPDPASMTTSAPPDSSETKTLPASAAKAIPSGNRTPPTREVTFSVRIIDDRHFVGAGLPRHTPDVVTDRPSTPVVRGRAGDLGHDLFAVRVEDDGAAGVHVIHIDAAGRGSTL